MKLERWCCEVSWVTILNTKWKLCERNDYVDGEFRCLSSDYGTLFSGEGKEWRTPRGRVCGHIRENGWYFNQANNRECVEICKALVLGGDHSRRIRARYRGKDRGCDWNVEDGDECMVIWSLPLVRKTFLTVDERWFRTYFTDALGSMSDC